jgi:hypothetical protein
MVVPSKDDAGRPFDSVWAAVRADGGVFDHVEAMVFDRGQALPVAVITYAHVRDCGCAECARRLEVVVVVNRSSCST